MRAPILVQPSTRSSDMYALAHNLAAIDAVFLPEAAAGARYSDMSAIDR